MKKTLDAKHNPTERAAYTAIALGINLNINYEAYGSTESLMAMRGESIVRHDTRSNVISWLCGLHSQISSLLSMLSSCNVHHQDFDACMKHLSDTCAPTRLKSLYSEWVYKNNSLIRELES